MEKEKRDGDSHMNFIWWLKNNRRSKRFWSHSGGRKDRFFPHLDFPLSLSIRLISSSSFVIVVLKTTEILQIAPFSLFFAWILVKKFIFWLFLGLFVPGRRFRLRDRPSLFDLDLWLPFSLLGFLDFFRG